MWYGSGMGAWGFILITVSMVLFWALVIFGVIVLVRYLGRGSGSTRADRPATVRRTPEEVLAERFAAGEIDEQEYRRRLDVLHGRAGPLAKP
jgi:putative membrane protein